MKNRNWRKLHMSQIIYKGKKRKTNGDGRLGTVFTVIEFERI